MSKPKKTRSHARSLLAAIRDVAASLPTTEERNEAVATIRAVEAYLAEVRAWLELLPTSADTADLQGALSRFDVLVEKTEQNPLLARVFGDAPKPKPRKTPAPPSAGDDRARTLLATLDDLTIDQIREKLQRDPTLNLRDMRALAQLLELRFPSKISRETLANSLTTRIANQRGYRHLSGSDGRTPSVDDDARSLRDDR